MTKPRLNIRPPLTCSIATGFNLTLNNLSPGYYEQGEKLHKNPRADYDWLNPAQKTIKMYYLRKKWIENQK